jgi:hypothetical protein
MTYEPSRPLVGATGLTHQSKAEAQASFSLACLGIVPWNEPYPVTFKDANGTTFTARSDFIHEASGVRFEFKAASLNSIQTKAYANKALARVRRDEALGFVNDRNRNYKMLKAGWNHSISKQAAVVAALTPANVVLIFKHEPSPVQARRLGRAGIFWRTMKTLPVLVLYLKMASQGLDVGFSASASRFPGIDAGPWHVFGNAAEGRVPAANPA